MISMKPVLEPDVIDLLNNGRFEGDVEAYVMSDGTAYFGHMLYKIENSTTLIIDTKLTDYALLDGIVRAVVAKGSMQGADCFEIISDEEHLLNYKAAFCKNYSGKVPNSVLMGGCGGCKAQ